MFSRDDVANFINQYFEPAWETIRPVPLVHIDFGDGNVLTRTWNGNVATYVCQADGQVLDVLPGIYTPSAYVQQLCQFRLLAQYADQQGVGRRVERLTAYHRDQAEALGKKQPPDVFIDVAPITKMGIERPVVCLVSAGTRMGRGMMLIADQVPPRLASAPDDALWKDLKADTEFNETVRRRQVHEVLAAAGACRPEDVKKRLYREVLHADLDDRYLGMGPMLFDGYPFKDRTR